MDTKARLDEIQARLTAGNRTASLELFKTALGPIQAFLRRRLRTLTREEAYDLATEAIAIHVADPSRFNPKRGSLWGHLCRVALRDGIDLLRHRRVETKFTKGVEDDTRNDVEFWTSRTKDTFRGEDAIDARKIMTLYGRRLVTNEVEAKILVLILHEEKRTEVYAEALGIDPAADEAKEFVKKAKDRMLLRLKRLRDEL